MTAGERTTSASGPGEQNRAATADGAALRVARPAAGATRAARKAAEGRLATRRSMLRSSLWAGLGVTGAGFLLGFVNYVWPRSVARAGAIVTVPAAEVPPPGADPRYVRAGRFYLVNLQPGEGMPEGFADYAPPSERGGILALSQKCPHLGCAVPWRPEFAAAETRGVAGWFRCPCHMSTYSRAGVRVFGPAPRSMDLFPVTVHPDGSVQVDTSRKIPGSIDNPRRAVLG